MEFLFATTVIGGLSARTAIAIDMTGWIYEGVVNFVFVHCFLVNLHADAGEERDASRWADDAPSAGAERPPGAPDSPKPPPVRIGVGLHYGPVVLGDIGNERRLEFAVLGDTVNVASRLEGLTRELEAGLVASGELVARVREEGGPAGRLVSLGERSLRGRAEPVEVFVPGAG